MKFLNLLVISFFINLYGHNLGALCLRLKSSCATLEDFEKYEQDGCVSRPDKDKCVQQFLSLNCNNSSRCPAGKVLDKCQALKEYSTIAKTTSDYCGQQEKNRNTPVVPIKSPMVGLHNVYVKAIQRNSESSSELRNEAKFLLFQTEKNMREFSTPKRQKIVKNLIDQYLIKMENHLKSFCGEYGDELCQIAKHLYDLKQHLN